MELVLKYGKQGLKVNLPSQRVTGVLRANSFPRLCQPEQSVFEALTHPIASPALNQLAKGKKTACVVISDITRPVPNRVILPPILETLQENGISREAITILIATGLHRPGSQEERLQMLGPEIGSDYSIVDHQATGPITSLGHTRGGTPVLVNPLFTKAELKITTGLIEPHFMAGYSGGRKAVCPGICGLETIKVQHGPRFLESPRSREGVLTGNPFHQEALEIAQMVGVDFSLNVSVDEQGGLNGVFAGELEEAHQAGVKFVEQQVKIPWPEPVEIVVTTGGGYPLDLTFYQTIKGMSAALPLIKKGGTIIIASECAEGIGGAEFTQLIEQTENPDEFLQRIAQSGYFVKDQWEVEKLCHVLKKAGVFLYTEGIPECRVQELMVEPTPSVEEAAEQALKQAGKEAKIAVIPEGPYVLPVIEGQKQPCKPSCHCEEG
ncbi:MAG: nickel-dependent lactate racemase [Candidatus Latescibacteria bacterium]|nr:nickel-dependent lactate racemase [Candidatus Latescibacterota bacterium]